MGRKTAGRLISVSLSAALTMAFPRRLSQRRVLRNAEQAPLLQHDTPKKVELSFVIAALRPLASLPCGHRHRARKHPTEESEISASTNSAAVFRQHLLHTVKELQRNLKL